MKTKYLFYSLALASAFTACTQEELIEAPVVENNVADRPVAGVVEFSTEGVESRFNHESATWQNGDVFGLYLMDDFKQEKNDDGVYDDACPGEHLDANEFLAKKLDGVADEVNGFSLWAYQDHWFGMYEFTNHIQSNYPFTYSTSDKTWTNDAKLVEGNYFAMYPQNKKALNRRELWHQIDPSVTLKKHSKYNTTHKKTFVNLDNQFFLGYSQIYRNETSSVEGALKMDIALKGAMVPVEFKVQGLANNDVRLDRIEFKMAGNGQLPTLAFIEPAQENPWVQYRTKPGQNPTYHYYEIEDCEHHGKHLYSEEKTWTRQTIQSLIKWEDGTLRVPYGCEEQKVYSYSFEFPGEFDEKVELEGNKNQTAYAYFALPALSSWENVYAYVYGWQLLNEGTKDERWEYGILTNMKINGQTQTQTSDISEVNKSFALQNAMLNSWVAAENDYFITIDASFDQYGWVAVDEAVVTSTEQMTNLIKGRVQQASSGDKVAITVMPDANGVEVKKELVDWLAVEAKKYKDIEITFDGTRGGIVYFNENETMGIDTYAAGEQYKVKFLYKNGVTLENNATDQVIPQTYNQNGTLVDNSVVVMNNKNLKVLGKLQKVENYGDMAVAYQYIDGTSYSGEVVELTNYKNLTLEQSTVVGTLNNEPSAKVDVTAPKTAPAIVTTTFSNKREKVCSTCVKSVLNVNGGLTVKTLVNYAVVNVEGELSVTDELTNNYVDAHNGVKDAIINNNGVVNGKVQNYATVNNGNAEGKVGKFSGAVYNRGTGIVNAYKGELLNLIPLNKSVLNVFDEAAEVQMKDGEQTSYVIFKGVVAQDVDTRANDIKIFELAQEERLIDLMRKMIKTGSTYIKTDKNIIFEEYMKADGTYDQEIEAMMLAVEYIYVDGTDVVFKEDKASDWVYKLSYATVEVSDKLINGKPCKLSIKDETKIKIKEAKNANLIHVANGSSLVDAGGDEIDHNYNP